MSAGGKLLVFLALLSSILWLESDQLLRDGHVQPDLRVMPRTGFECMPGALHPGAPDVRIPRLFATYLRYGAKVLGPPAIDRVFGTIDFLTFLDFEGVSGATLELLT